MAEERSRVFNLDGISVKVLSRYDERCKRYIDEVPDLEEQQIYTKSGKLIVSAVQDSCQNADTGTNENDCGSCKFYRPEHPGDLIGVCMHEKRMKSKEYTDKEENKT